MGLVLLILPGKYCTLFFCYVSLWLNLKAVWYCTIIKRISFFCCAKVKINFVIFYERPTGRVRDKSECDLYFFPPVKLSVNKNAFKFISSIFGIYLRHRFRQRRQSHAQLLPNIQKNVCIKSQRSFVGIGPKTRYLEDWWFNYMKNLGCWWFSDQIVW